MASEPAMTKMYRQTTGVFAALALAAIFLSTPLVIDAAMSLQADSVDCMPKADFTPCGPCSKMDMIGNKCVFTNNKWMCPCVDHAPGGPITGKCVATNNCKGESFSNQQGNQQGIGDMKGMMDILKGVMDMLKKKEGGGGGGGGEQNPQNPAGCKQYYQVTTPSTDPCAYYVPPVSNTLFGSSTGSTYSGATTELINALNGGTGYVFSDEPQGATTSRSAGTASTSELTGVQELSGGAVDIGTGKTPTGAFGDIVTTDTGGTIYANSRDVGQNVEVAGFFGSDTFAGKMQGAIGNMCKTRPWAGSLISRLIPASFFDGLCSWRGYQVGNPPPPAPPPTPKPAPKPKATTTPAAPQQAPAGEPKVDIWAVPTSVSVGLRASIFWSTKNVESCAVSSSGGNFNEKKLSGGAATVPLTSDTTFTLTCKTSDGKTFTDAVTVTISP